MLVLGVNGNYRGVDQHDPSGYGRHDSAAVLVKDGEVLAAVEEERLDRIKHSNCFPVKAIMYCLSQQGLTLGDIDLIAFNHEESREDLLARANFLQRPDLKIYPEGRKHLAAIFDREFGVDVSQKLRFCNHHLAHAWSAYAPSGYNRALTVVLDGDGDFRSGMVFLCEGPEFTKLKEFGLAQSLGNLYTNLIMLLGYNRFDEYKVMGLAPYGDPSIYSPVFEKCYRLLPEGDYFIAERAVWMAHLDQAGLLRHARRKGAPFTKMHNDIAAAIQGMLERIVFHLLRHQVTVTKQQNLCLAGGVAHNCTMNGKILYSGLFKNVFVQPAAHDAGGALGAAYAVLNQERSSPPAGKARHVFLGPHVGTDQSIAETLQAWSEFVFFEKVDRIAEATAELLADGHVVGWVQGRSEFGPRALGNRSILADPRPAENKTLINQMVKKRESFRPFGPSVLQDKLHESFEVPETEAQYPFMVFTLRVKETARQVLRAVTHIDHTARVHSVTREISPLYYDLIGEFARRTGVPVLLNTSFNNNIEPIVDSALDAIVCYLTTGLHYLVIGSFVVSKKRLGISHPAYRKLVPGIPRSRRLVQRQKHLASDQWETSFELESTFSRFFAQPLLTISKGMFALLQRADGRRPFASLLDEVGVREQSETERLMREILDLWSERAVILFPQSLQAAK